MADSINLELGRHAVALAREQWGSDALQPLDRHLADLVTAEHPLCLVDGEWFTISIQGRQHELAKGEIGKLGCVPYLPLAPCREAHGRGSLRTVWRPMFGPYMFVKCESSVDQLRRVATARGVHRLLGQDGKPQAVEEGRIEVIRHREAVLATNEDERLAFEEAERVAKAGGRSGILWHFTPGETVRIKAGPFAQFYAQLETAVDSHDRISSLVSIFGRSSPLELSAFDIEKL